MINYFNITTEVATKPQLREVFVVAKGNSAISELSNQEFDKMLKSILVKAKELNILLCGKLEDFLGNNKLSWQDRVHLRKMLSIIKN